MRKGKIVWVLILVIAILSAGFVSAQATECIKIAESNTIWGAPFDLAWTGTGYGVVSISTNNLFFGRRNPTGAMMGGNVGIADIRPLGTKPRNPSLVWNPLNPNTGEGEYAVAWDDNLPGNFQIYFTRISPTGVKITSELRITNDPAVSENPSLVWNPLNPNTGEGEYAVAWKDWRDGNPQIYFARISPAGAKINIIDVKLTVIGGSLPSLVWNPDNNEYAVAWSGNNDGKIYFTRISPAGVGIKTTRITNAVGGINQVSLVWTGTEYAVAWWDNRDGNPEIYFARINADGTQNGIDYRITNAAGGSYKPSLVWNPIDNEYGVAWFDYRNDPINPETYFTRISSTGVKIGNDVVTGGTGSSGSSLAWTGSEYGIVLSSNGNDFVSLGCYCGDGKTDTGEECDNSAANSDILPDACRTDCLNPYCGDNVIDTGEQCDDGALNSNTIADACRTDCLNSYCGDNVIDTGEQCDDGNLINGDGCSATCIVEPCTLTSASWSDAIVSDGTAVTLTVAGNNCDGETVTFDIWEDDFLPFEDLLDDDVIEDSGLTATFTGNTAQASWNALYITHKPDGITRTEIGQPEYYFKAVLVDGTEYISGNILDVTGNLPPTIQDPFLVDPNDLDYYDDHIGINWTPASDPDDDALVYKIEYSDDSGGTWNIIENRYGYKDTVEENFAEKQSVVLDFG